MSAYKEFSGKTVEEALKAARDEFGAELNDLDFEILTPGSRGVLGMGADMHTASLFPGAPELAAALADDAPEILEVHPPDQPEARLTLTARVLRAASVWPWPGPCWARPASPTWTGIHSMPSSA